MLKDKQNGFRLAWEKKQWETSTITDCVWISFVGFLISHAFSAHNRLFYRPYDSTISAYTYPLSLSKRISSALCPPFSERCRKIPITITGYPSMYSFFRGV